MIRLIVCFIALWVCLDCAPNRAVSQDTSTENPFSDKMLPALFNPRIQNELELVDEQKAQLKESLESVKKLKNQFGKELQEYRKTASQEQLATRRAELLGQFEKEKRTAEQAIFAMLLPHQKRRLGQVTAQMMLAAASEKNSLGVLAPEMIKWLEIDERQANRLRERAREVRKKLAEDIARLTEKAKQDLLKELSPRQRKKYKELIGDPIKKQSPRQ